MQKQGELHCWSQHQKVLGLQPLLEVAEAPALAAASSENTANPSMLEEIAGSLWPGTAFVELVTVVWYAIRRVGGRTNVLFRVLVHSRIVHSAVQGSNDCGVLGNLFALDNDVLD